jgi:hypothetical protein
MDQANKDGHTHILKAKSKFVLCATSGGQKLALEEVIQPCNNSVATM